MAGIRSAREQYLEESGTTTFLDKKEMVEKKTEFCILGKPEYYTENPKYDPAWKMDVVYLDEVGQHVQQNVFLSAGSKNKEGIFKKNKYREWLLMEKLSYPAHSIMLTTGYNTNGQAFFDLDDCESIPPCPCQTGTLPQKNGKHNPVAEAVAVEELKFEQVESPIVETSVEQDRIFLLNLAQTSGWPIDARQVNKMNKEDIRKHIAMLQKFKD